VIIYKPAKSFPLSLLPVHLSSIAVTPFKISNICLVWNAGSVCSEATKIFGLIIPCLFQIANSSFDKIVFSELMIVIASSSVLNISSLVVFTDKLFSSSVETFLISCEAPQSYKTLFTIVLTSTFSNHSLNLNTSKFSPPSDIIKSSNKRVNAVLENLSLCTNKLYK
jgi:hypothetical protein